MKCVCRKCTKVYNDQSSRSDWAGYCSQKCLREMLKKLGYRKGDKRHECDVLRAKKQIGAVPYKPEEPKSEKAEANEFAEHDKAKTAAKAEFMAHGLRHVPKSACEGLDGWDCMTETSGAWCWSKKFPDESTLGLYATPFWEDNDSIIVEFCDCDGETYASALIPFALTGDAVKDAERYMEIIKPFLMVRPDREALT